MTPKERREAIRSHPDFIPPERRPACPFCGRKVPQTVHWDLRNESTGGGVRLEYTAVRKIRYGCSLGMPFCTTYCGFAYGQQAYAHKCKQSAAYRKS